MSTKNFENVMKQAMYKSGLKMDELNLLLPLHTKRSMFEQLLEIAGLSDENAIYLDHHGHMQHLILV